MPSDYDKSGSVPPLLNVSAVMVPEHSQARRSLSLRCVLMTGSARPGARYGQFWRWILTEVGVTVGQPGSTDSVLCFERVPAWSVVWVLAGDIGECRGWLLCSSSA